MAVQTVTATELSKHTGRVIDLALRAGKIAVTRHRRRVAYMVNDLAREDVTDLPETTRKITATELFSNLAEVLGNVSESVYAITRHGRAVVYLIPRQCSTFE